MGGNVSVTIIYNLYLRGLRNLPLMYIDQKTLGFSMRTERADVTKVKERLLGIKRKIDDSITRKATSAVEEYESKVATQVADDEIRKRKKKEEEAAKKAEREAAELDTMDPEIAAIMGFGKFG